MKNDFFISGYLFVFIIIGRDIKFYIQLFKLEWPLIGHHIVFKISMLLCYNEVRMIYKMGILQNATFIETNCTPLTYKIGGYRQHPIGLLKDEWCTFVTTKNSD